MKKKDEKDRAVLVTMSISPEKHALYQRTNKSILFQAALDIASTFEDPKKASDFLREIYFKRLRDAQNGVEK